MSKKIVIISIITLILDQIIKIFIETNMQLNESIKVIENFFYITYVNNYGAGWSMLQGKTILLIVIAVVASLILYRFMFSFKPNLRNKIAFGLLFGGIAGNLLDRLFLGFVRDFLSFNIFGYKFPIFNIADSAISIGMMLLILAIFKGEDNENSSSRKTKKN